MSIHNLEKDKKETIRTVSAMLSAGLQLTILTLNIILVLHAFGYL